MANFIIVGAGGFGREVFQWLEDWIQTQPKSDHTIKGFLSLDVDLLKDYDLPVGVLGSEFDYEIQESDRFIIAIGSAVRKKVVVEELRGRGAKFFGFAHPTTVVSKSAKIGEGTILCPFATVCADTKVGQFCTFNIYSSAGHDSTIGHYSVLSPYATLNGFATVGEEAFLGTHSTILAGKTVGNRARISANALVVSNVAEDSTVLSKPGVTIDLKLGNKKR